ncbi:MAG: D-sedoheptulose-7-phosphate isomerase [Candidatus Merdivicinus sp.]|jgi:D-sedoheptulose 7-phosphate isomerase
MFEELYRRYPILAPCKESLEQAARLLLQCFQSGGKLLVCGNGGSSADSGHIVGELMKGFRLRRPIPPEERQRLLEWFPDCGEALANELQGALPAISLPDQTALFTACANDISASIAYGQMVYGYGRKGDVLLTISTSGNSENVVNAARIAKFRGLKIIALTGEGPCLLDRLADATIHVPEQETARIQELHLPVYHALCAWCEEQFFNS